MSNICGKFDNDKPAVLRMEILQSGQFYACLLFVQFEMDKTQGSVGLHSLGFCPAGMWWPARQPAANSETLHFCGFSFQWCFWENSEHVWNLNLQNHHLQLSFMMFFWISAWLLVKESLWAQWPKKRNIKGVTRLNQPEPDGPWTFLVIQHLNQRLAKWAKMVPCFQKLECTQFSAPNQFGPLGKPLWHGFLPCSGDLGVPKNWSQNLRIT